MKPIDLENLILVTLRSAGGQTGSDGMTIARLQRAVTPAGGKGPVWRLVANAVYRLERAGLVQIVGDELVGTDCHPLFALTRGGVQAAQQAINLNPWLLQRGKAPEADDADH